MLTDASVITLAQRCHLLVSVDFGECGELTDTSMIKLTERCPLLSSVNWNCDGGWQQWPDE